MSSQLGVHFISVGIACLMAFGAFLFLGYNSEPPPDSIEPPWWAEKNFGEAIENIEMLPQFRQATENKNVVLFVDADYNGWTLRYRDVYVDFSTWLVDNFDQRPLFVDVTVYQEALGHPIPQRIQPSLFGEIQKLLKEKKDSFGYKNHYGAGIVAWHRCMAS